MRGELGFLGPDGKEQDESDELLELVLLWVGGVRGVCEVVLDIGRRDVAGGRSGLTVSVEESGDIAEELEVERCFSM